MNIQIIYGKNKTKEDMSNIFFLYTKNGIIFIGDNMVKQETINERELPIAINIFLSVFSHIPEKTTIKKEPQIGQIVAQTAQVYHGNYQINQYLHFDKYNKMVSEFYELLDSTFGHCNLSLFYKNFKTLKIKERRKDLLDYLNILLSGESTAAEYDQRRNKMYVVDKNEHKLRNLIAHELLHMATSKEEDQVLCCGFHQINKKTKTNIGIALNEGYTEHLNQQHFFPDYFDDSYLHEQSIAYEFEKIIGREKMEKLYFEADLYGLIQELTKYASVEEIITFLRDFDKLHTKPVPMEQKEKEFKALRKRIAEIYLRKQKMLLDQGKISEDTYKENKLIHADIFVNQEISFSEGAIVSIEDGRIKIIDSNRGVFSAENADFYLSNNNLDEIIDIMDPKYYSHDTLGDIRKERQRG